MYVVAQNRLPQSGQTLSEAVFEFLINTTEMPQNICENFSHEQSCSVSKETIDLTVTRGTLWSDKV